MLQYLMCVVFVLLVVCLITTTTDVEMNKENDVISPAADRSRHGDRDSESASSSESPEGTIEDEEMTRGGDAAGGGSGTGTTRPPRRLFTIHSVNSYGSSEVDRLHDDGSDIKFTCRLNE